MNVNDRIALEIGRAKLSQIIAEEQLVQLQAQVAEKDARIAELSPPPEGDKTAEDRGGSGPGSDHGGASDAATG